MTLKPFGKDMPLSFGQFQSELNQLFERFWHGGIKTGPLDGQDWAPPIDVLEEEDRYVVTVEVPGLESSDIDVAVSGDTLSIKGHRASLRREGDEHGYLRTERQFGSFLRTVQLPVAVEADRISATCRKGVLEITLPKKEEHRPKAIRVEVSD
ncbi:MAG: Hsp20/alpha crystallin family protein [Phycisphaerae bacterium]|nr:Hsp20/alpha crystallin family protein [Phycisphaerae bacterium]